ncbi:QUIRKY protein [Nymphaea thermarum]|nr:QUIRKY protein [Nymphaea thermarum]
MTTRKLIVDVVGAYDLLPKDGVGTSSPYVVADFDGQRRRTQTKFRDLNPTWDETLEFVVTDPASMAAEDLEVEVYNDKKTGNGRKNHFLGRVRIPGSQFVEKGKEALVYFPLERKSLFSAIKGELGLRIYYVDEPIPEPAPPDNAPPPPADTEKQDPPPPPAEPDVVPSANAVPEEALPPQNPVPVDQTTPGEVSPPGPHPQQPPPAPEAPQPVPTTVHMRAARAPMAMNGEFAPKVLRKSSAFPPEKELMPAYDLVEPMLYLFVRIVKARGIAGGAADAHVKIRAGGHCERIGGALTNKAGDVSCQPEWHQVFAFDRDRLDLSGSAGATLEISIWSSAGVFFGGVCFDLSEVPLRIPPDSPLAPQWYRLDGNETVSGDLMLAVWIGTQADDAFPEAWQSDAPFVHHSRSKVYHSPKLWYLRVAIIEAHDLNLSSSPPPKEIRVKIQLGFQSVRSRPGRITHSSILWREDLMLVAGEPLEDSIILLVEDRSSKEASLLGHISIPLTTIEQRIDESRIVPSKWFNLESNGGSDGAGGRIHLRLCLEGGYHVLDEAAHLCSDFRPTAKQLWKPPIGTLELGILGARALLPMKTKGGRKGSTDAYCVAKYGRKWVRTRTITDSFEPRWNEQYTWEVYDPSTVLTLGVFDNWRMFGDSAAEGKPDYRMGKVRIRLSMLESNRVYTNSYPLLVLLRSGVKKMGEIELAVRFCCPSLIDMCAVYGQPLLPRMHYLYPIGVAQQDQLRGAAMKMVAAWFGRSEPPLGPEVVQYMLDTDSHVWSIRRSKANWFRIMNVLTWVVGLARWVEDICRWRNPVTTILVHVLFLVLVWYPELLIPTLLFYVFLMGAWYYRFRPKIPAGMDIRLSQAEAVDPDELDEEFDGVPTSKPPEIVRIRYDRLRTLAARIQTVLGDFATQGERFQALLSWRDPRATRLCIWICLLVAIVLYVVPAKMVAVAGGFYLLRHPMFRDPMPPAFLNFFRRLPSLSERLM